MAQVIRPRDGDGDRGQMILLMGVVLAVMFVALALLVNAAIYTDNVATRGGDPAGEALEYQNGVVDSTEGLIEAENDAGNATADDVRPALENISRYHRQYHLRRGAATNTSFNISEGRNISEVNANGFEDWNATANTVRGFVMHININNMSNNSTFEVILPTQDVQVNRTGKSSIVIEDDSGGELCSYSGTDPVRFNITNSSLSGESCGFNTSQFDDGGNIGIDKETNGAGGYEALIESDAEISGLPPNTTTFIYRVELNLRVNTPELQYERRGLEVVSEVPNVE